MLQHLEINNIALIDRISMELNRGLNILTGETGAGKSIIIDSINAILGGRLSKDFIRTGKEKATVEAVFQVDNERFSDLFEEIGIEPEEDGTLIISREFNIQGRNICRINGRMTTVSMLREIGTRLIDVHGQHDNQSLLRTENHQVFLDSFAGARLAQLKEHYTKLFEEYKSIKDKLLKLSDDKGGLERKIDLLKYQINEIKAAGLKKGEDEELYKQKVLLSNSEKIITALTCAYDALFSGDSTGNNIYMPASDTVGRAMRELNSIAQLDKGFEDIALKLEGIYYQISDVAEEIRNIRDGIEYDPDMLEKIEERIDLIYRLKKKYGSSIEEILDFCKKAEAELEEILNSEELIKKLRNKLVKLGNELYECALKIHNERCEVAGIIEGKIEKELEDLEMKKTRFKVFVDFDERVDENGERPFTRNGLDMIEFMISPNVGEPLKPLSKIASGGEMSRIMLAIKNILANVDSIPTLIFDEIDIGISGKASQKVGEKLYNISKNHQVICVTHQAQIACMADNHFLIEKISDEETTRTSVKKLNKEEIKNEIARILGGAVISDITIKHAEEMLEDADRFKKL
ncbi:MAG TPA: DNA repair protein RecN [Clostridiaceae bacterium]|nr:DNA repair protein RecN [Clostridiaceae bacterium]